jgi:hypothetical protein
MLASATGKRCVSVPHTDGNLYIGGDEFKDATAGTLQLTFSYNWKSVFLPHFRVMLSI